jgi:RNA polymerase sigma factor for flagellar operon FliA
MGAMAAPQLADPEQGGERLAALWQALLAQRDLGVRAQLVAHYMRFARMLAAKSYARRGIGGVDFDDYLQHAHVGLIESIDRYDPQRGIKFETYAATRITGAILNGLEAASDIHGQVAARRRLLAARTASLDSGQDAPDGPQEVFGALAEIAIGLALGFALDETGMVRSEERDYPDSGYAALEMKQIGERALALLAKLPGNQRLVIQYHYLQHIAFEQIALMLELSKGRIAQIHKEALGKLRAGFHETGLLSLSC